MRRYIPLALGLLMACGSDSPKHTHDATAPADTVGDTSAADAADTAVGDASDAAEGDTSTPAAGLEATIAALCPGYAAAYCEADCGCAQAPGFPDDCVAAFSASCAAMVTQYAVLVDSGQAVFKPEGAATCLESFAPLAAACVPIPSDLFFFVCPILAPPGGFPPLPGLDEACEGPCATGLRCGTDRTCLTPGATGATCASDYDCELTLVCAEGQCAAPRHGDIGERCEDSDGCGGDTGCLASAHMVCRAPVAGGPCRSDDDCPSGAWCDDSAASGTCEPGGAVGEPCGNGIVCQEGLACDASDSLCGPFPTAGEPCAQGRFGPFLCAAGLVCLESRTCGEAPAEGEPCGLGEPRCAAGLGCAYGAEGSTCNAKVDAGAYCDNDDTCGDGLFCDFGANACMPFLARGELCTDGNECGPGGSCLPDAGFTAFRCADEPKLGEGCFLEDCAQGLICRTPYEAGVCAPTLCTIMRF